MDGHTSRRQRPVPIQVVALQRLRMGRREELVGIQQAPMDAGVRQPVVSHIGLGANGRQCGQRFRSTDGSRLCDRRGPEYGSICQFVSGSGRQRRAGVAGEYREFVLGLSGAPAGRHRNHVDRNRDRWWDRAAIQMVRLRRQQLDNRRPVVAAVHVFVDASNAESTISHRSVGTQHRQHARLFRSFSRLRIPDHREIAYNYREWYRCGD